MSPDMGETCPSDSMIDGVTKPNSREGVGGTLKHTFSRLGEEEKIQ